MPPIKSKDPIGQYHFTNKNSALIFVIGTTSFVDIDNCLLIAMLTTDVQETAIAGRLPALGRDFELESFYNICTDKIISGIATSKDLAMGRPVKLKFYKFPRQHSVSNYPGIICQMFMQAGFALEWEYFYILYYPYTLSLYLTFWLPVVIFRPS